MSSKPGNYYITEAIPPGTTGNDSINLINSVWRREPALARTRFKWKRAVSSVVPNRSAASRTSNPCWSRSVRRLSVGESPYSWRRTDEQGSGVCAGSLTKTRSASWLPLLRKGKGEIVICNGESSKDRLKCNDLLSMAWQAMLGVMACAIRDCKSVFSLVEVANRWPF